MEFEIVKLTQDKYKEWNDFCLKSNDAWFWHTTDWIEYILNYSPGLETKDLSFLVYKRDKLQAAVLLTLESHKIDEKKIPEFSFGGWPIPTPVLSDDLTRIEKDRIERDLVHEFIFNEIDRVARCHNVARVSMRQTPLSYDFLKPKIPFNYLMKFGYNDISSNTQIIDLNKTEDELWNDLRRNHRRNIKKGSNFNIAVYTAENITWEIFNAFKEMHHKAAGRKTRPDKTFESMYEWIKENLAFLVAAEYEGKYIGFEYYNLYKNNVYGSSAANDPDYGHLPVRHTIEWKALLWMKQNNVKFYEIGQQQYGAQPHDFPDKKQIDISHFKKGFGGFTIPWFMAEKYYDKDYFLKINQERINKFVNYI